MSQSTDPADVLVVGGGSAGAVLAARLQVPSTVTNLLTIMIAERIHQLVSTETDKHDG